MTLNELFQHTWTISALAIALERADSDDDVARAARDVVRAAGLEDLLAGDTAVRRADLRSTLGSIVRVAMAAHDTDASLAGWNAEDPKQVEAQGVVSEAATAQFLPMLKQCPGLLESLEAGGAVLDVGAGAAGFCIGLARRFPTARVVGVEISPVAAAVGRRCIAESGLGDRIELREQGGEQVTEVDAYDLVYVAQMFMPDAVIDRVLAAAVRALRPGGWLITGAVASPGDTVAAAVSRLRNAVWGGGIRFAGDVIARLGAAGLAARTLPVPPGALAPILGRKQG